MMSFFNACRMIGLDRFGSRFNPGDRIGRMGFMSPGLWLAGLLIAILVIVGIVFLIRAIVRSGSASAPRNYGTQPPAAPLSSSASQALQILDERLARGEIDTDEYRRRKDELLRP